MKCSSPPTEKHWRRKRRPRVTIFPFTAGAFWSWPVPPSTQRETPTAGGGMGRRKTRRESLSPLLLHSTHMKKTNTAELPWALPDGEERAGYKLDKYSIIVVWVQYKHAPVPQSRPNHAKRSDVTSMTWWLKRLSLPIRTDICLCHELTRWP